MKGWPSRLQRLLDDRMAAAFDGEFQRVIDHRARVILVDRELCQRGRHIEQRERVRRGTQIVAAAATAIAARLVEDLEFKAEGAVAGIGDLGLDFAQLGGGETHLSGECLAMDEGSR